jgi:hypothetical protein
MLSQLDVDAQAEPNPDDELAEAEVIEVVETVT